MLQIGRVHYPVTSLGFGKRLGIWVQGCSIRCPECLAKDTWEPDARLAIRCDALLASCRLLVGEGKVDGVTISGGEPTDQAEGLTELVPMLRSWLGQRAAPTDILCYSGQTRTALAREHAGLVGLFDAMVVGPFAGDCPTDSGMMGSGNQEVLLITELGRKRYGRQAADRVVQMGVEGDTVLMIGIPRIGDLAVLKDRVSQAGLEIGGSWEGAKDEDPPDPGGNR